ncbi:MAG TPA: hypothetical protein VKE25_04790 [Actinomycetes bacterium]|nr:hypothetical protein [Actinomycetes bacterium]
MDRIAQRAVAAAERTLRDAELWATMASLLGGQYPHLELTTIGSLIGESGWSLPLDDDPTPQLVELLAGCRTAHEQASEIRTRALAHIASHTETNRQGQPVIVFNAAPVPRSGMVWLHHEWPGPGIRGIAVLDEWDRVVRPALDDVVRRPDSSIASAWIGWAAKDVPSVGYRTFHLVPESVTPWPDNPAQGEPEQGEHAHGEQAPATQSSRPPPCASEPSETSLEPGSPPVDPPLRVQLASRQTGHLPASFSLLNLQPAGSVAVVRISLTADDAIRILLQEISGQQCGVELRMFVPFPDDLQVIELAPHQLVTVTGVAEPPAWAGPGPTLSPAQDRELGPAASPGLNAGPSSAAGPAGQLEPDDAAAEVSSASDLQAAVTLPLGEVRLAPGQRASLPISVTGSRDGPITVQAVAPYALWPLLPQWHWHGVLHNGTATVDFEISVPTAAVPADGWIAVRAGRPGRGFGEPRPATLTVTDGTG